MHTNLNRMSNPFALRLQHETDAADVHAAIEAATAGAAPSAPTAPTAPGAADRELPFTLVDARSRAAYDRGHLPGAVSAHDPLPDGPLVAYCWSPGCNAATKLAARLFDEGRDVKEMIGGFEYWVREGFAITGAVGGDRLVGL
jgi:rhodanese-related sulfurtransferase